MCWAGTRGRSQWRRSLPGVDFQAVRSMVSMAQVLELIGFVAQKSSGGQLRGPCPLHGSRSPRSRSFSANLERNAYQCFKCGSSGNQLDLWAAVTKTDLHTAAIDLCEKAQVDVPWIRKWWRLPRDSCENTPSRLRCREPCISNVGNLAYRRNREDYPGIPARTHRRLSNAENLAQTRNREEEPVLLAKYGFFFSVHALPREAARQNLPRDLAIQISYRADATYVSA